MGEHAVTAAQAFGMTAAVLLVGTPLATLALVGAIYIHEAIAMRRYRAKAAHEPVDMEDTAEFEWTPPHWLRLPGDEGAA